MISTQHKAYENYYKAAEAIVAAGLPKNPDKQLRDEFAEHLMKNCNCPRQYVENHTGQHYDYFLTQRLTS